MLIKKKKNLSKNVKQETKEHIYKLPHPQLVILKQLFIDMKHFQSEI